MTTSINVTAVLIRVRIFNQTAGWRHIEVTNQRTKVDFAKLRKDLLDIYCREADVIRLVLDNRAHPQSSHVV
jgi:hypothetical protein